MRYSLVEVTDAAAIREATVFEAESLSSAKRKASKNQVFQNTILFLRNLETKQIYMKDKKGWQEKGWLEE